MGRVDKKSWRTCDWELKYVLRREGWLPSGQGGYITPTTIKKWILVQPRDPQYIIKTTIKGVIKMNFQLTHNKSDVFGTSNLSYFLAHRGVAMLDCITPNIMRQAFGSGMPELGEPSKGYTDPEWYFRGPGDTILGIGFRWSQPRLRGKNIHDQFLSPQDICEKFINEIDARLDRYEEVV